MEIDILAILVENFDKCPPLDQFLDTRLQSDKLKLEVSEIIKKYFTAVDFKIISLNKSITGQFFNFKDKLPHGARPITWV